MIEIEVKAQIEDPKAIEREIIEMGGTPVGIESHADTYYKPSLGSFDKTGEELRIRVQDGKFFLIHKARMDEISKTRKELKVIINDANIMGDLLSSLGYSPVATIVKKRKNYRIGDLSVVIDDVRNLGNFIEVEINLRDNRDYEERVESIFRFIDKLGINRKFAMRESYLELYLGKKKKF